MQRKRRPERENEPEVTFELEETPRAQRSGSIGAAGAAAIAGAGLASSAAASGAGDSLDVFDQADETLDATDGVPVTSYQALLEADGDAEFPPIDFAATDAGAVNAAAAEEMFGASAEVGGGFVLETTTGDEAFAATDLDIEPVPDTLLDDDHLNESLDLDEDDPEDIELS